MAHQLLPPKNNAPSLPQDLSSEAAVLVWIDLMKSADRLVMAGFVSRVGVERAQQSYRRWYAERSERHGAHIANLAIRLRDAGES